MEARRAARMYKSSFKVAWRSDEMVVQLKVIGLEFRAEKVEVPVPLGGFHATDNCGQNWSNFSPGPAPRLSLP
jgi:hypothetical protein